jgi:YD repeat-containing protein
MPDTSDPFDDDAFFADIDISALEAVEAQAISATQVVRAPPQPQPRATNLQKEPRPINTEPRAGGKSTFGFGELGKHTHPANETRYIDGVEKRKQYWGIRRDDDKEDEENGYPVVTIDATGQYDLARDTDDEDQVVDTHAPGGRGVAYTRTAALQRSSRTETAGNVAGPSRLPAIPPRNPAEIDAIRMPAPANGDLPLGSTRVLARSASVGKQVFAPRGGRLQPGLAPILSQSNPSQSMPSSSQGSQARRSVLQLDDEKRRREDLEREVERLQAQLQASKTQNRHWTDGIQVDMGNGNPEDRVRDLQGQLWKAKGEAENIRRMQKTVSSVDGAALIFRIPKNTWPRLSD